MKACGDGAGWEGALAGCVAEGRLGEVINAALVALRIGMGGS